MSVETHALAFPWHFTYFKKVASKSYEENTYTLGTTTTVRQPLSPVARARTMLEPHAHALRWL